MMEHQPTLASPRLACISAKILSCSSHFGPKQLASTMHDNTITSLYVCTKSRVDASPDWW
jgi:hypothetical protein